MRSSKTTFSAWAWIPSGSLESSFKKRFLYSTFHILLQRPIETFCLPHRKLFIIGNLIHKLCQAVIFNKLFHAFEFLYGNLNGYRFLVFIKYDVFMNFKHARPPSLVFIVPHSSRFLRTLQLSQSTHRISPANFTSWEFPSRIAEICRRAQSHSESARNALTRKALNYGFP